MRRAQLLKIFPSMLLFLALLPPTVAVMAEEASPQGAQPSEAASTAQPGAGEEGALSDGSATSGETDTSGKTDVSGKADTSNTEAEMVQPGLWAFLDPETGELVDTPIESQNLLLEQMGLSSVNKSSEGLEAFELQGGGRGVNLSGRFRSALMVHRKADGTFEMRCSDHPDQPSNHTHRPAAPVADTAPVQ